MKNPPRMARAPVLAVLLLAAALRFWKLGSVPLIGDEAYYWLWSEHLAPCYLDHPSAVAWVIRLSTLTAGRSELGIRWLTAGLGVVAVALTFRVGVRLFSRPAGLLAASFVAFGAPYLIISRFAYTDMSQLVLLLSTTDLLASVSIVHGDEPVPGRRFWAIGISMAALFNTKYNAYLYALGVLAFILWRRSHVLRDPRARWAIALAALGLLPAILWNAAHGWVSWQRQIVHLIGGGVPAPYHPLNNLVHAARYLTPPLSALAAAGVTRFHSMRRQALLLPAAALIVPILLSPANSPRNVVGGTVLLVLLAADALSTWAHRLPGWGAWAAIGVAVLWVGIYGLGTVWETMQPAPLPGSSAAPGLRAQSAGWREAAQLPLNPEVPVFALDYSMAGQLRYYAGLPAQTSWEQYRLWGIPDICAGEMSDRDMVQMVGLTYVDPIVVSERLKATFWQSDGPREVLLGTGSEAQTLRIWTARGCRVDQETFLDRFDLLRLIQAGGTR